MVEYIYIYIYSQWVYNKHHWGASPCIFLGACYTVHHSFRRGLLVAGVSSLIYLQPGDGASMNLRRRKSLLWAADASFHSWKQWNMEMTTNKARYLERNINYTIWFSCMVEYNMRYHSGHKWLIILFCFMVAGWLQLIPKKSIGSVENQHNWNYKPGLIPIFFTMAGKIIYPLIP